MIGEGGSGGAVALATADKVLMLENSIYSVISPEGCASILWKVEGYDETAANSLKITSKDLEGLKVVDKVIKEPVGGAHRNTSEMYNNVKIELKKSIEELGKRISSNLSKERKQKYLKFGSNFNL